ncbi:uncharacterized protein LOC109839376 [Asparagus officinalis]|uniref:uncharacterized protein LOC109839376 n=1 Tax=Asparagus officinalis TaxID=4686 RepID=UPI00098DF064|nr:uncharacterized protein LOC109839376 [Asparagus officinalis]
MKDNESVKEFSDRVTSIINQIRSYGDKIEDKKIVEKILRSLSPTWDHIVAVIKESKDLSKLSFYELMTSLESHELRRSRFSSQEVEQAFQSKLIFSRKGGDGTKENKERIFSQKVQDGGGNYHERKLGRQRKINERDKDFSKEMLITPKKDCWYQKNNKVHYTEVETDHLLYSCFNAQPEEKDIWYLDSGCSNHMTGNKSIFVELKDETSSQIKLGDRKLQNIEGKRVIAVQTNGGKTKDISDVLYVTGLTQNLLSVGQLIQKGYAINFFKNECVIIDDKNKQIVARIKMAPTKFFP